MRRIVVPTKDRPGNLSMCLTAIAQWIRDYDEFILYDDGDRPATADYGTRFALDIMVQRNVPVSIFRGKPLGIAESRARMLEDAEAANITTLFMIDDDVIVGDKTQMALKMALTLNEEFQYMVPTIALANNEANVKNFHSTAHENATHQQHALSGKVGIETIKGGAWTAAIMIKLDRIDVQASIDRLRNGPKVVEDYALTAPLLGGVTLGSPPVWHVMSPAQGERAWESLALDELRKQLDVK